MKLIIIGGLGCLGGVIIKERKPHSNWPTKLSKKLQPLINIVCTVQALKPMSNATFYKSDVPAHSGT